MLTRNVVNYIQCHHPPPPLLLERSSSHTFSSDGEASFYDDEDDFDFDFEISNKPTTTTTTQQKQTLCPAVLPRINIPKGHMTRADEDALRDCLRVSLHQAATDAASLGRLTRLKEKVVESIAVESVHNTVVDSWTGVKSSPRRTGLDRSNHFKVIQDAAAMGQLKRSMHTPKLDSWNEEDKEDRTSNEMPRYMRGGKKPVSSSSERMEQYVRDKVQEKGKTLYAAEHVLDRQEENERLEERFQAGDLGWLPSLHVPVFKSPKVYLSFERRRAAVAQEAAKLGESRSDRLRCNFHRLNITKTCKCSYCKNPNPMQTQAYNELRQEYYRAMKSENEEEKNLILTKKISLTPTTNKIASPAVLYSKSRSGLRRVSSLPPPAYEPFERKEAPPVWSSSTLKRTENTSIKPSKEILTKSTDVWATTPWSSPIMEKTQSNRDMWKQNAEVLSSPVCAARKVNKVEATVIETSSAMPTESVPVQPTPILISPTPEKEKTSTENIVDKNARVLSALASPLSNKGKKEKEAVKEILGVVDKHISAPVLASPKRTSPKKKTSSLSGWASPLAARKAKKEKRAVKEIVDKNTPVPPAPVWASPKLTKAEKDKEPIKEIVDKSIPVPPAPVPVWASPKLKKTESNRDMRPKLTRTLSSPVWASPTLKKTKKINKSSKETVEENAPVWVLATGKRDSSTLPEWASESLRQIIMK